MVVLWYALLLTACESDAKRLDRLQRDHAKAVLEELRWREMIDSAKVVGERNSGYNALEDSLSDAELRTQLAQRALNRFMAGR